MEEKIFEVDMIYIRNSEKNNYSIECASRRGKSVVLNFKGAEGIELRGTVPFEVRNAFMSCTENDQRMWNMKFNIPANLKISFSGKITIESL